MPKRPPWPTATLASPLLFVALQGCASPMTSTNAVYPPPGHFPPGLNRLMDGPLRFWQHSLGIYCFRTWGCRISYGGEIVEEHDFGQWQPPAEEVSPDVRERMRGHRGQYRNFRGPLVVTWRDSNRTSRHLEIDLARVFADGLIRHSVPEEDIAPGYSIGDPAIIVEVDDTVVRLHMRTLLPLKQRRDPNNPASASVESLVQVFEQAGDTP
jgi:hypothetical protein